MYSRPIVLSIAGFDPTGGAGVLSDIKTFEQNQCLGFSVISAKTIQIEAKFIDVKWLSFDDIIRQMEPLFANYSIGYAKIGIIQNLECLETIVNWLKERNNEIKIIWDPVISSSSGFLLLNDFDNQRLREILKTIYLLTPNWDEMILLSGKENPTVGAELMSEFCSIYLKGGHSKDELGTDYLFTNSGITKIVAAETDFSPKHGSGCILSSAITSNLAKGNDLETSSRNAKMYIEKILGSNNKLLAYHNV